MHNKLLSYIFRNNNLFRIFSTYLDTDYVSKVFSSEYLKILIDISVAYYKEYNEVPKYEDYNHIKAHNKKYATWFSQSSPEDRVDQKEIESKVFLSTDSSEYTKDMIRKFMVEMYTIKFKKDLISTSDLEEVQKLNTNYSLFIKELDTYLSSSSSSVAVTDIHKNISSLTTLAAVRTSFTPISLYQNTITVLISDSKMYKTGIALAASLDLMQKGMHVLYFDLENGLDNMQARLVQAICGCSRGEVLSGTYVRRLSIRNTYDINGMTRVVKEFDGDIVNYADQEIVYRVVSKNKNEDTTIGFDTDEANWITEVRFYEVGYNTMGIKELLPVDYSSIDLDGFHPYRKLEEVYQEKIKKYSDKGGEIQVTYLEEPTPAAVERYIRMYFTDTNTEFFKDPARRVVVIDWMQLMDVDMRVDKWERKRAVYKTLKDLRKLLNFSCFVIDGVSNPETLSKAVIKPDEVNTSGTRQIRYDVESLLALAATPEEKSQNVRRIETLYNRNEENTCVYVQIDFSKADVRILDDDQYCELCPETAQERGLINTNTDDEELIFD